MKGLLIFATAVAVALGAAGCSGTAAETQNETVVQIAALQQSISALQQRIEELESDDQMEDLFEGLDGVAYLTPGADGYSVVRMDLGHLTVQLADVQPYANGSRVSLRIGNVTGATINGAKAKIEWGSVDDKGTPKNAEAKSREVEFSQPLQAGAWSNLPVVLEGIPPTELGFVRVRDISHKGIRLTTR
jgi:hypothetical protein